MKRFAGFAVVAAFMVFQLVSAHSQQATSPIGSPTDPAVHEKLGLPKPANPKLATLFLVGDSTVRNGHGDGAGGQWGWGEPLVDYFDPAKINVVNRAIGGRSSRTYITERHWDDTLALMKAGDIVLFQFGHNDSGPLDDTARARGTLKGVGEETQEIENPILQRHETVHTYGWYMRKYVDDTLGEGCDSHHLLSYSSQDMEGRQGRSQFTGLWRLGSPGCSRKACCLY
jgi:rhamnogalacturonan acetylesterase